MPVFISASLPVKKKKTVPFCRWALCSLRSHGTKSAMPESKLSTGTSRTKRLHQDKFSFSLFWMSQCVACSPAWWILYHMTASCKGPIATSRWENESYTDSVTELALSGDYNFLDGSATYHFLQDEILSNCPLFLITTYCEPFLFLAF